MNINLPLVHIVQQKVATEVQTDRMDYELHKELFQMVELAEHMVVEKVETKHAKMDNQQHTTVAQVAEVTHFMVQVLQHKPDLVDRAIKELYMF